MLTSTETNLLKSPGKFNLSLKSNRLQGFSGEKTEARFHSTLHGFGKFPRVLNNRQWIVYRDLFNGSSILVPACSTILVPIQLRFLEPQTPTGPQLIYNACSKLTLSQTLMSSFYPPVLVLILLYFLQNSPLCVASLPQPSLTL